MGGGDFKDWVDVAGKCIDGAGVAIVVLGLALASVIFISRTFRAGQFEQVRCHSYTQRVGFTPCVVDVYLHDGAVDWRRRRTGRPSTGSPKLRGSSVQR